MQELSKVSLQNLGGGAVAERFDLVLREVLQNILDLNTPAKQKRSITLTVTIIPNEDRTSGQVGIDLKSKLASIKPEATIIYFGKQNGEVTATEYNPKQPRLDFIESKEIN